jgi:hypothetical protein
MRAVIEPMAVIEYAIDLACPMGATSVHGNEETASKFLREIKIPHSNSDRYNTEIHS